LKYEVGREKEEGRREKFEAVGWRAILNCDFGAAVKN
jgi:hypothetical protein